MFTLRLASYILRQIKNDKAKGIDMRTRLGSAQKSPIERLSNSALNNIIALVGVTLALLFIFFGGNIVVKMINFLSVQSEAGFVLHPESQEVYIAKGIAAVLVTVFMLKK